MRENKFLLPLIFGMFSATQIRVVGSIGISELVCYIVAPFILIKDASILRRDGFMPVIWLSIFAMIGCCLSSLHNNTAIPLFLRGLAVTYSLFALPICMHRMLRGNLSALKWILLGLCISGIINIFWFRQATALGMAAEGLSDVEMTQRIISGPLFWLQRVGGWLALPVTGWYLQTPTWYALVAPLIMVVNTIVTTDSGRSAMMSSLVSFIIIFWGGKKICTMKKMQNHIYKLIFTSFVVGAGFLLLYKALAATGHLNEMATNKYEAQTKMGGGALNLLMAGRSEVFIGLFAALDNPIWGWGPWALDEKGFSEDFLSKYGSADDYQQYLIMKKEAMAMGLSANLLPSHSHIIGFWMNYGLLALPFWFYIVICILRHFRYNITSVPQWFGYFALSLPVFVWHIMFSPYGGRVSDCLIITCMLLADAIRRRKLELPYDMVQEIYAKGIA